LKNKLGTKAVPTAELELNGTVGKLIGPQHKGVSVISTILNITRLHNAVASVSGMRRGIAIARDYAYKRYAFGKLLAEHNLHLTTLSDLEIQFRAGLQFLMEVLILLGKVECQKASKDEEILLRLLTPLLKLYTAKQAIAVGSECIECMGGAGYMEDTGLPRLLRDAQVGSIWEGTTNVLSLDVWRPIKSSGALEIFMSVTKAKVLLMTNSSLKEMVSTILQSLESISIKSEKYRNEVDLLESNARSFAFSLSRTYMGTLLLEQAQWSGQEIDIEIARRWINEQVSTHQKDKDNVQNNIALSREIALDIDPKTKQTRAFKIGLNNIVKSRL